MPTAASILDVLTPRGTTSSSALVMRVLAGARGLLLVVGLWLVLLPSAQATELAVLGVLDAPGASTAALRSLDLGGADLRIAPVAGEPPAELLHAAGGPLDAAVLAGPPGCSQSQRLDGEPAVLVVAVCEADPDPALEQLRASRGPAMALVAWEDGPAHAAHRIELAHALVEAGALLVVGHGSGRVGPLEVLPAGGEHAVVLYDAGRVTGTAPLYVEGLMPPAVGDRRNGLVLRVELYRRADGRSALRDLELIPVWIEEEGAVDMRLALAAAEALVGEADGAERIEALRRHQLILARLARVEELLGVPELLQADAAW